MIFNNLNAYVEDVKEHLHTQIEIELHPNTTGTCNVSLAGVRWVPNSVRMRACGMSPFPS